MLVVFIMLNDFKLNSLTKSINQSKFLLSVNQLIMSIPIVFIFCKSNFLQ